MNPFFEVVQSPVFYGDTGSSTANNLVALINPENENLLGIVTKNYHVVTNKEVFDIFNSAMSQYKIKDVKHRMNAVGNHWKCDFIFDDDKLNNVVNKDDIVGIALRVFNSYNRVTAYGYEVFGYRWICENGMIFGKKSLFSKTFKHFVGNAERLRGYFESHFTGIQNNVNKWIEWSTQPFGYAEFEGFLNMQKKVSERIKKNLLEAYYPTLKKFNDKETKWGTFNVLTHYGTHEIKDSKKGTDAVFRSGYNQIVDLSSEFYKYVN